MRRLLGLCCVGVTCMVQYAVAEPQRRQPFQDVAYHAVQIEGTVRAPDGGVLPGVTLRLLRTGITTTSDAEGRYTLVSSTVPRVMTIVATLDNFSTETATRELTGPLSATIDFTLTPTFASDIVVGGSVPPLDAADDVSRVTLSPAQIAVLPSLGERDIFRAFQLLPGVSGSNETASGLFVRGGTPDQTRVEYDGFRVYGVDHLLGYFSAFNMDAVESAELSKGGFEAQDGGALSSVMRLTGRSGQLERAGGSVGMSLLSTTVSGETPLFGGRGSAFFAGRRSFQGPLYDKILSQVNTNSGGAIGQRAGSGRGGRFASFYSQPSSNFYDINGKVLLNPSAGDRLSLSVYRGDDHLDNSRSLQLPDGFLERLAGRGLDPVALGIDLSSTLEISDARDSGNTGVGLEWSREWNARIQSQVSVGYSVFNDTRARSMQLGFRGAPSAEDNRVEDLSFKAAVPITVGVGHTLEGGIEITSNSVAYSLESGATNQSGDPGTLAGLVDQSEEGRLTALYLQDRLLVGSRLLVVPGIRLTSYDKTSTSYSEPRLAATFFVNDRVKLKASGGRYYQFIHQVTREDVLQGNQEFWSLANGTTVPVAESTQLIGGGTYEISDWLVDVELFTKDLSDLTQLAPRITSIDGEVDFDDSFFHGDGTARGGELLIQKRTGRHTGWVSYTLSHVEEKFLDLEPTAFPAGHDQRHEFKVVNMLEIGDWHLSGTWIYASGKPFSEPVGLETFELPNGGTFDRVIVGDKNGARLPAYHRSDVALNRQFPIGSGRTIGVFGLSLFNLYDRQNIWYKEFNMAEGEIVENNIQLMGRTLNASFSVKF